MHVFVAPRRPRVSADKQRVGLARNDLLELMRIIKWTKSGKQIHMILGFNMLNYFGSRISGSKVKLFFMYLTPHYLYL